MGSGEHLRQGEGHGAEAGEEVTGPAEREIEQVEALLGQEEDNHQDEARQENLARLGHILTERKLLGGSIREYNTTLPSVRN